MKTMFRSAALALVMLSGVAAVATAATTAAKGPVNGVARLMDGNARYTSGKAKHPNQDRVRLTEVAKGQSPFAIVVSCSDSRVPPEVVFDQGLGDIFVVRTAGHVVDPVAMGSIEFAVAKLGARSILVVGHERCGAVEAALEHTTVPGSIGSILKAIQPAVGGPEKATPGAMDKAVQLNVSAVTKQLRDDSPILAPMVKDGSLEVAGGVYDLDTGKVTAVAAGSVK